MPLVDKKLKHAYFICVFTFTTTTTASTTTTTTITSLLSLLHRVWNGERFKKTLKLLFLYNNASECLQCFDDTFINVYLSCGCSRRCVSVKSRGVIDRREKTTEAKRSVDGSLHRSDAELFDLADWQPTGRRAYVRAGALSSLFRKQTNDNIIHNAKLATQRYLPPVTATCYCLMKCNRVVIHLIRTKCVPILLYGLENFL